MPHTLAQQATQFLRKRIKRNKPKGIIKKTPYVCVHCSHRQFKFRYHMKRTQRPRCALCGGNLVLRRELSIA